MATYYKEGVCGELCLPAAQGLRKVKRLYALKNKDLYITSIREGTHSMASFHYIGLAWDHRQNGVPVKDIKAELGPDFDVVKESDHIHCELDPK